MYEAGYSRVQCDGMRKNRFMQGPLIHYDDDRAHSADEGPLLLSLSRVSRPLIVWCKVLYFDVGSEHGSVRRRRDAYSSRSSLERRHVLFDTGM